MLTKLLLLPAVLVCAVTLCVAGPWWALDAEDADDE